ncbi:nucleoside-triphosphatase [Thermohalobacter berrensis]|uniref:nucleoside-triphosphatase n=1 Tax=Thermohalobacter berrensis TaxID=99594 RepID=UPI0016005606|nr:nucleoside-triphosphatase [Thermohalobacter berrensis]
MVFISNIFLTGKIKVGKSTILNKVLNKLKIIPSGFKTLPFKEKQEIKGYYIKSNLDDSNTSNELHIIAKKNKNNNWNIQHSTFDVIGVEILKNSLKAENNVILMDELGFFESKSLKFQDYVFKCLDSEKIVLGVIKPIRTSFLNKIRNRQDTIILHININNRDKQFEKVEDILNNILY